MAQKIIIPKGSVDPNITTVIEIPPHLQESHMVMVHKSAETPHKAAESSLDSSYGPEGPSFITALGSPQSMYETLQEWSGPSISDPSLLVSDDSDPRERMFTGSLQVRPTAPPPVQSGGGYWSPQTGRAGPPQQNQTPVRIICGPKPQQRQFESPDIRQLPTTPMPPYMTKALQQGPKRADPRDPEAQRLAAQKEKMLREHQTLMAKMPLESKMFVPPPSDDPRLSTPPQVPKKIPKKARGVKRGPIMKALGQKDIPSPTGEKYMAILKKQLMKERKEKEMVVKDLGNFQKARKKLLLGISKLTFKKN